jgi:hypothetical protein
MVLPDGTLPPINDSHVGLRRFLHYPEILYLRYGDESQLRWLHRYFHEQLDGWYVDLGYRRFPILSYPFFNRPPEIEIDPALTEEKGEPCVNMDGCGLAILRSDDPFTAQQVVMMDYGPYFKWHHHRDKLNLLYNDGKKEILLDLGYARNFWSESSFSHNTVVVDNTNQEGAGGQYLIFENLPGLKIVEAEAPDVYPQVSDYRRLVAMVETPSGRSYLLDVFDVAGGKIHDWYLHLDGATHDFENLPSDAWQPAKISPAQGQFEATEENPKPGQWKEDPVSVFFNITDTKGLSTDSAWDARWQLNNGAKVGLYFPQEEKQEVFLSRANGYRSYRVQKGQEKKNDLLIIRKKNPGDTFLSVIESYKDRGNVREVFILKNTTGGFALVVDLGDCQDILLISKNKGKMQSEHSGISIQFEGRFAFLRLRNGEPIKSNVIRGTMLKYGDRVLSQEEQ